MCCFFSVRMSIKSGYPSFNFSARMLVDSTDMVSCVFDSLSAGTGGYLPRSILKLIVKLYVFHYPTLELSLFNDNPYILLYICKVLQGIF